MTHQEPEQNGPQQPDGLELNKETLNDLDLEVGNAENVKGGGTMSMPNIVYSVIASGVALNTETCGAAPIGQSLRPPASI